MLLGICAATSPGCAGSMRLAAPSPAKIEEVKGAGGTGAMGSVVPSSPGPWGQLEVIRITTEPPEEYVAERFRFQSTQWFFPGYTREKIVALFRSAGLDEDRQQALWTSAQPDSPGTGWVFRPEAELLISLAPLSRQMIYLALAKHKQNAPQHDPFRWRAAALAEWFVNGGLSDATIRLISKLLYYRGQAVLFADPELVLATLPDRQDQLRTLKTLARQSTLLVKLKIRPDTDIAALTAYWGRHNRSRDIGALLESMVKVPGGCTLDVIHLLPRFARTRLYTYPIHSKGMIDPLYDCHWTSMNFWNDPPDNRLGEDPQYQWDVLNSNYDLVREPYKFGDLLFLTIGGKDGIHSAVYIADDIVFTKNGTSITSPWILMELDRMLAYYETETDLQVLAYRWTQKEDKR